MREVKKCRNCGALYHYSKCDWCNNTSYDIVEYPTVSLEDKKLFGMAQGKLTYILSKAFNEIQPTVNDCFGCLELIEYLKEVCDLDEKIYELVGITNKLITCLENSEFIPEIGKSHGETRIKTDKGQIYSYSLVYYDTSADPDFYKWKVCSKEEIIKIEEDIVKELKDIINIISDFKSLTTGMNGFDESPFDDIDFDINNMKKARDVAKNFVNKQKEFQESQEKIKKAQEERNLLVAEMTKPVINTDPNFVERAICPNCHMQSVYRISSLKKGASIWAFGLFSSSIGKTMECRSCGYKW